MSRAVWRQADAVTESGVVRDAAYGEPLGRVGALIQHRYPREVLADAPMIYYRLAEPGGTQVTDASGNGYHATTTAATVHGEQSLVGDHSDRAIRRASAGALLVRVSSPPPVVNTLTVEWWFKAEGLPPDDFWPVGPRRSVGTPNFNGWSCDVRNSSGTPTIGVRIDTSGGTNQVKTIPTAADVWDGDVHHIVLVIDDGVGAWYTDGVLRDTFTYNVGDGFTVGPNLDLISHSAISSDAGDRPGATYDEVAYYDYALSAERIAAHYAARLLDAQPWLTIAVPDVPAASFGAALGFAPLYDSAALPAGEYVVYDRRDDDDNRITLVYERPENRWALHRYAGGHDDPLYVADTFTAGVVKHLAIGGDAEHLYLQVDGGTRNEGDNAMPLVLTSTAHDIGQAGGLGALPAVYAYAIPYWRAYTEAEGAHFASLARPPHTGDVPRVVLP